MQIKARETLMRRRVIREAFLEKVNCEDRVVERTLEGLANRGKCHEKNSGGQN